MKRGNVIILIKGDDIESWGSLTELCRQHQFSYNYLKQKKFPFMYKGIQFCKIEYRTKLIET